MTEHIPEDLFVRFLHLESSKEDSRRIVRHLLIGCPQCAELAYRLAAEAGLFGSGPRAGWEEAYERVFTRALAFASEEERRLALEKLQGWSQWAALEPLKPQLRFSLVESDSSFHTFGFYERLLEASRWYSRTEPAEAVDIVRLALAVAERLDPAVIGEGRVADLRAAAWATLGSVLRIAEDFEGARRAFNEAWSILESGTGDSNETARLICLEASYLKDIGEFEAAESSLETALAIYRRAGDLHHQGRVLIQMGEIIGHLYPEKGIDYLRKALEMIDVAIEPRLLLCAQHALAYCLVSSGRPQEGLAVLERARPLYRQFQDETIQLRMHWLEGKIAFQLGEYNQAEGILKQVWEEFHVRTLKQEAMLVAIDLAQVLIRTGEPAHAAQLAAECYVIASNWGLYKDAFASWLVYQEALSRKLFLATS